MGTGCMKLRPQQDLEAPTVFTRSQPSRYGRSQLYRKNLLRGRTSQNLRQVSFFMEGSSGELIANSPKTQEDLLIISKALNSHFIFSSISEEDKEVIADSMQLFSFPSGATIFKQGMPSKSFYVVRSGSVDVLVDSHKVNKLQPGAGFGELALISQSERSTTIKCAELSTFWVMEREIFKKLVEEMSTEAFEQNRMFLDRIHLLSSLTSAQKDLLAANMVSVKYRPGSNIIQEGDKGEVMFIIKEGTVSVTRKGQEINQLTSGSFFGEQALISNSGRNATCTALTVVYCVCLSREVIQQVLKYSLKEIIQRNSIVEALNKSLTLGLLKNSQKDAIVNDLTIVDYNSGDIVIARGDLCRSKLFVIVSGRIQNSRNIHLFAEKGFCIGDDFIDDNNQTRYEDDFIAGCDMQIGEITKYQLELTLGGKYEDIVRENSALAVLRKVWLFNYVDDKLLKSVIPKIQIEKVLKYQVVLKPGKQSNFVYIVKKGKIDYFFAGKVKKTITKYGFFGENSLLKEKFVFGSYAAAEDSQLWVISHQDFEPLVNDQMLNVLNDRESQINSSMTLNNSIPIKLLGKGLYSKVFLMMSETGLYYALKTYEYSLIDKVHINQQILNERQVLNQLDHPFIVSLFKTQKDSKRIYFFLEFIQGVTLEFLLQTVGILTIKDSRFYIACLIIFLQYLHERDILYRDLNPENIMIDQDGFIKMVDFNSSKVVTGKTYTLVTCPYYIAPEVICGRGYTKLSEVWSLGVLLFEFLCGKVPFGQTLEDPLSIYEEVLKGNIEFPSDIPYISENAKSFIVTLLQRYPENRHSGSVEKMKGNPFFIGFDWEETSRKLAVPPFKSEEIDPIDIHNNNFGLELDLDEFIDGLSDSDESLPPIDDFEIAKYVSRIPPNWDSVFE